MSSWDLATIYFPWIWPTMAFVIGLCVGSFLNVCIYRMPRGLSIAWPGSFCPRSGKPLQWWENIPVISWVALRGRGRVSGKPISLQYPAVELLTAIAFLALYLAFPPPVAIALMVMTAIFIAGSFIDWQFKIIPDSMTVGGAMVGLVASVWVPALHGGSLVWSLPEAMAALGTSLTGMLIGSAIILWMAILGEMALRREAMGFGDVKLLGMIGAFLGWQGAVFAIFGGAFVGIAVALVGLVIEKTQKKGTEVKFFGREMPFGPMLCTAALIYIAIKPVVIAHWSTILGRIHG